MDNESTLARKLLALAAAVLLCVGVPYSWRNRAIAEPRFVYDPAAVPLLPDIVGDFSVRSRSSIHESKVVEQVAIYSDKSGGETVQADVRLNSGPHNGLACYLSHGMPVLWSGLERVQAADAAAEFDVKILQGTSMVNGGYAMFLMAATECGAHGCGEAEVPGGNRIHLTVLNPAGRSDQANVVPFSVVIETSTGQKSKDELLREFREFMKEMPLTVLSKFSAQLDSTQQSPTDD